MLMICFDFLGKSVDTLQYWYGTGSHNQKPKSRGAPRSLTPINEFFLVLCRLRLSLLEQDLAFRFGISQSTVSRICNTWINLLYSKFKEVNIWPSRQQGL